MLSGAQKNLLLTSFKYIKQKEYWVSKLAGAPAKTRLLPGDDIHKPHPTPKNQDRQEKVEIHIPADLFSALLKLSKGAELSLYLILLAALESLVYQYTGNEDIMVLSPLYKPNISGDTLNHHLIVRQQGVSPLTFKELLLEIRESVFDAYENQDYPIDDLMDFLYNSGQIPEKDICPHVECLLQNIHDYPGEDSHQSKHHLVFSFLWEDTGIKGHILYNPGVYNKFYLDQAARHLVSILENGVRDIDLRISRMVFLSPREREQLIQQFNQTQVEYGLSKILHLGFAEQAAKTPHRTAVVSENRHLSYSHLNKRTLQLAKILREKGVKPDRIVGILMERSLEMVVAILAILTAGGAYLPIEPEYPEERIEYIINDSALEILLVHRNLQQGVKFKGVTINPDRQPRDPTVPPETNPEHPIKPGNLAYAMYTSGSTGNPKGVMITHQNAANLIHWFAGTYHLHAGVRVLQLTDYNFDPSVEDIFATLLYGAELHVAPKDVIVHKERFRHYVERNQINIINFIPTLLKELVGEGERLESLIYIISGGEPLEESLKDILLGKGYALYNHYGPTEITTDALTVGCTAGDPVTLGTPIANTRAYILGEKNKLQPIGVPGELCISGAGLARGYLNQPELTAEKFDHDLWDLWDYRDYNDEKKIISRKKTQKDTIYRTGDQARWLPGGCIQFLGRTDRQVKIRGYRIELGEIENRLMTHKDIKEAVVTAVHIDNSDDKYICAYIVGSGAGEQPPGTTGLREYLLQTLPGYMIPSYFIPLETIPLAPNGKVDWKALPTPQIKTAGNFIAPRNESEEKMARVWAEVLEIDKSDLSIDSNFFQLGGHSLKATILGAKIHKEFNVKLPLAQIFKASTIRELAGCVREELKKETFTSIQPTEKKDYYSLSSAQKRLYIQQQMELNNTSYNMPQFFPLAEEPDQLKFQETFKQLIRRHESFRTSFHMVESEPVQRVHDEVEFEIEYYNSGRQGDRERGREGNREIGNEEGVSNTDSQPSELSTKTPVSLSPSLPESSKAFIRPFDLSRAPLLRVGLAGLADTQYFLMVDMHHIISDGISTEILISEFSALYVDANAPLPELKLQYKDYSQWQDRLARSGILKKQGKYWLDQFKGKIPVMNLPADDSTNPDPFAGEVFHFSLGKDLSAGIHRFSLEADATKYMVLLASLNILLSKYMDQEDIVVGVPVFGRGHLDLLNIVGMFVNMLPMRNYPQKDKTFASFLGEVKENALAAYENQDYQFEQLVWELDKRGSGQNRLEVNVVFDLTIIDAPDRPPGDREKKQQDEVRNSSEPIFNPDHSPVSMTKFDLILGGVDREDEISLFFEYRIRLFKQQTIERMSLHLKNIFKEILDNPQVKISDINMLGEAEKNKLIKEIGKKNNPLQWPGETTGSHHDKTGNINVEFDI